MNDQPDKKQDHFNTGNTPPEKTPEKKVWVKGSHRNGKRPKLKWI